MKERLILVSSKLPLRVRKNENEVIKIEERFGGFASGLKNFYKKNNSIWIGWTGIDEETLSLKEKEQVKNKFLDSNCFPVHLKGEDITGFFQGFCNSTIWPLFHYLTQDTVYDKEYWRIYKAVNQIFADEIVENYVEGDRIWIHDYHLMLVPNMVREKLPGIPIGFFLHIPFPSYEIFRLMPWRTEILEGLLGADQLGFHTFDYERHFMSCVRRLMGYETFFNRIRLEERIVKVDAFPMGIDYDLFYNKALEKNKDKLENKPFLQDTKSSQVLKGGGRKVILSMDRLDYDKGIADRLNAYEFFLEHNPEYIGKVSLLLFVVPSHDRGDNNNDKIKQEVDQLVGSINGKYGIIDWMPIWYFYRYLPLDELVEIYKLSDIALITPNRDGMNLIAKEYIACKTEGKGVLILSEMAGAAKEMGEALIVNPNNREEVAGAIKEAIEMPVEEQESRNKLIQKRLKVYNEDRWANDFIKGLEGVKKLQEKKLTTKITPSLIKKIKTDYDKSGSRMLFLDYDGTLAGFHKDPQKACPDDELYSIVEALTLDEKNEVTIISGRDKETLGKWFQKKWNISFIAEHGVWARDPGGNWGMIEPIDKAWMDIVRPIIEFFVDRTPRSFIEEKNYSLVWHYRNADPDLGVQRSWELKEDLKEMASNLNLEIMDGDKVIEIKSSGINKGRGAAYKIGDRTFDFMIAIGDDWTDEYTFDAMPGNAYTIKVGTKSTKAKHYIDDVKAVRELLKTLSS